MEATHADVLSRLGLFVARDVLDPEACAGICAELRTSSGVPARIWDGTAETVDTTVRRSRTVEVGRAAQAAVGAAFGSVRERLSQHFGTTLRGHQTPRFLLYRVGDFFGAHSDSEPDPAAGAGVRERRVSAVLFLNSEGDGGFAGGALTFYGLFDGGAQSDTTGLAVTGAAGLLVAFPSDVVHAVTPVTDGERCTAVTWFR